MDGAGKKLLMFMESAQQQLGGGAWLDMRAQMRSLDQSTNNNHSHTNSSQEKDHLHTRKMVEKSWLILTLCTVGRWSSLKSAYLPCLPYLPVRGKWGKWAK